MEDRVSCCDVDRVTQFSFIKILLFKRCFNRLYVYNACLMHVGNVHVHYYTITKLNLFPIVILINFYNCYRYIFTIVIIYNWYYLQM